MDNRKAFVFALIAIFFSLIALGVSDSITSTGNNTLGLQLIVNNTNLAPFVAGHGGTGERVGDNTTYWNNNTPIEIFLYSHANTSGFAAEIHLFINGTKVSDTSGRALGVAEQSNRSIVAIVPQYSYYSVDMVNYHHYEWYEYLILTGNVTTTSGTGGVTNHSLLTHLQGGFNGTCENDECYHLNKSHYDALETIPSCGGIAGYYYVLGFPLDSFNCQGIPYDNLSWQTEKVNKSGDTMTPGAILDMNNGSIHNLKYINSSVILTMSNEQQLPFDVVCPGSACIPRYYAYSNSALGNYFLGLHFRGNRTNPLPLQAEDQLFNIAGAGGYDTSGTPSGTRANINLVANQTWNSTAQGSRMDFGTTNLNSALRSTKMVLESNGSLKINSLAGVGDRSVCVHADGTFFAC